MKLDEEEELSDDEYDNENTADETDKSTLSKIVDWFLNFFGLCKAKK